LKGSPYASRLSTFRAPGWGTLAVLPPCRRWGNTTSWKLVPFSHRLASRIFIRQPGLIPSPVVTQDWGGECAELGSVSARAAARSFPQRLGGRAFAVRGAGNYRVSGSPVRAASALLPVPPSTAAAGRCFSADEIVGASRGLTSNSTAFYSSSPLEWGRGRGPHGSSIRPEVIAAVVRPLGAEVVVATAGAGGGEPSGALSPRGPSDVGGCSYPWGRNQSSVCNGTLSAGVCSLWLSGPEHVCIFGTEPCFFLISSARTRLSAN
jgi:hypothetical protein